MLVSANAEKRAAALLEADERRLAGGRECFAVWESPVVFVVLGRSGKAGQEIFEDCCTAAGVPVLRRSSGGGTVLQGPGCLDLSLVFNLALRPELIPVASSYARILGALADALTVPGLKVSGSDLLLDGRKVSGSAQRRTRGWLLHHATLLYAMDLPLITQFLREPVRRPDHREARTHAGFLRNLPLARETILSRLTAAPLHGLHARRVGLDWA
jgi:lipoate---protein ligase